MRSKQYPTYWDKVHAFWFISNITLAWTSLVNCAIPDISRGFLNERLVYGLLWKTFQKFVKFFWGRSTFYKYVASDIQIFVYFSCFSTLYTFPNFFYLSLYFSLLLYFCIWLYPPLFFLFSCNYVLTFSLYCCTYT